MSRFNIGDKVVIGGSITTRHRNRQATVVGVHPSKHARPGVTSLDKYTVRFEDDKEILFYDNQLTRLPDTDAKAGTA